LEEAVNGFRCAQLVPATELTAWADAVGEVSAEWPVYRSAALADSQVAAERHSPGRYQKLIEQRLSDVAGQLQPAGGSD
jgi:hypothetical protein